MKTETADKTLEKATRNTVFDEERKERDRPGLCGGASPLSFHRRHPDWANKAVFFVLPEAKQPHKFFGQPEYEADKLKELVALGFEIGSHTLWHANLGKYDDTTVQKQLALSKESIQKRVPGYAVRSLRCRLAFTPRT